MCISYDGTKYSGWQIQPSGVSIQGVIEKALYTLLKTKIRIIGAGRTDAGVHALAQIAHFSHHLEIDCNQILKALNGILPFDIRIKELAPTLNSFHAQYSAISKEYHYHLWLGKTVDPFLRLYRHHFPHSHFSSTQLMEAARYFIGTHNFSTFANTGSTVVDPVRTLFRLDIIEQEGGYRLEFEGDGFLYKMVRNIVGTLLEVASGKRSLSQIQDLFNAQDRRMAGAAAPPRGLFLVKVNYPLNTENELK